MCQTTHDRARQINNSPLKHVEGSSHRGKKLFPFLAGLSGEHPVDVLIPITEWKRVRPRGASSFSVFVAAAGRTGRRIEVQSVPIRRLERGRACVSSEQGERLWHSACSIRIPQNVRVWIPLTRDLQPKYFLLSFLFPSLQGPIDSDLVVAK